MTATSSRGVAGVSAKLRSIAHVFGSMIVNVPADRLMFGSHLPLFILESALLKLQESELIESMKQFSSEEKQLAFANRSTIWNHGPAGRMDLQDLAGLGLVAGQQER